MLSLSTDKSILTAQLEHPGDRGCCSICCLRNRYEYRTLDALLYGRINDLGTREQLCRGRGFRRWQAYSLLGVGSRGLRAKVIILFDDVVDAMTRQVEQLERGTPVMCRKWALSAWLARTCPRARQPTPLS